MENKSIPSKIIDVLTKKDRLTINQIFDKIFDKSELDKKEYLRCCINRLSADKRKDKDGNIVKLNPKIAKDGKIANEYLYSLKNKVTNPIVSFSEYNELFKKLTKTQINKENLKKLAKETLNLDNIKKLEEMIEKNGFLG